MEEQLKRVLAGEALITALLTGFGWLTGNLTTAVRQVPVVFAIAIGLTAASFAAATVGFIIGARAKGNLNDLDQVVGYTNSFISGGGLRAFIINPGGTGPVDLNTPEFLSRYFRDEVLAEARPLYESP